MDLDQVLQLLGSTFLDEARGSVSFENADGTVLRLDLDIAERYGRAVFQRGNDFLVVAPGAVTCLASGVQDAAIASTQGAWDAWKLQPPLTMAPVASGLQLISTGSATINSLAQNLASLGGNLAVGGLVVVCWHSARYDAVTLPGLSLKDVVGRVCFRDITFSATEISFSVCLEVTCEEALLTLGSSDRLDLRGCSLRTDASIRLDLISLEPTADFQQIFVRSLDGAASLQGIDVTKFFSLVDARHLRFEKGAFRDGTVSIDIAPAQGAADIDVTLPATLGNNDVAFVNVQGAQFGTLTAELQLLDTQKMAGQIELRGGRVQAKLLELHAPSNVKFQPRGGAMFDAEVKSLTRRIHADGGIEHELAFCLENDGKLASLLKVPLGEFRLEVDSIDHVKCNAWNVGRHDARLGFAVEHAKGRLVGSSLPGGKLTIEDATVRLFWDEYGPCIHLSRVARRHLVAQFELLVAGFPKRVVDEPFRSPEIPISPSAILHYVGDRIENDVLDFVLDVIARGFAVAGVIDVEVFIEFHGTFTMDFDPVASTDNVLVFHAQLKVKMDVIVRVYGQIGICPFCLRVKIKEARETVNLLDVKLDLEIEWEFDTALNTIRIRRADAINPNKLDLIATLGELIADIYLQQSVVGKSVQLPPGFHVRGVRVSFGDAGDDTVRIGLAVEADSVDWT